MEYAQGGELFDYIVKKQRYAATLFHYLLIISVFLAFRVPEKESCKYFQ